MIYFAVAGDIHGRWAQLADDLESATRFLPAGATLDAIFQTGDAEATATQAELDEVFIKPERRQLSDFSRVLSGEITFGAPLYFIGGNHEPWRTLDRNGGLVAGGGELAPDVRFLGRSGCLEIAGMRVAFLSGIQHPHDSDFTVEERMASVETREHNFYARSEWEQVADAGTADLLLSHEWPTGSSFVHKMRHVGDERVRELIGTLKPAASFHGHFHRAERFEVASTAVYAMGKYGQGVPEVVAVFEFDPQTRSVRALPHVLADLTGVGAAGASGVCR
jgi:hypothetical protein